MMKLTLYKKNEFVSDFVNAWNKAINLDRFDFTQLFKFLVTRRNLVANYNST